MQIVETTRCSLAVAELALHDASNNVELAVNNIFESEEALDTWTYQGKTTKKQEEREEPVKKGGNRGRKSIEQIPNYFVDLARRGNQREQKGARATENGAEGRENRQPREKTEDGGFRGKRDQQPRNRREQGGKRDSKKPSANSAAETKIESDDHWVILCANKNNQFIFFRKTVLWCLTVVKILKTRRNHNRSMSRSAKSSQNHPMHHCHLLMLFVETHKNHKLPLNSQ